MGGITSPPASFLMPGRGGPFGAGAASSIGGVTRYWPVLGAGGPAIDPLDVRVVLVDPPAGRIRIRAASIFILTNTLDTDSTFTIADDNGAVVRATVSVPALTTGVFPMTILDSSLVVTNGTMVLKGVLGGTGIQGIVLESVCMEAYYT